MKQDEKFVITINRELGSGGRSIGEKLAKRLCVPFYDKALIQQLKEKYGLSTEEIERLKGQQHNWWFIDRGDRAPERSAAQLVG